MPRRAGGDHVAARTTGRPAAGAALEVHVRNAVTAALRVMESQADAVRFIVSLQKIVADCGQS